MALYTLGPVGSNIIIKEHVVAGQPTTYTYIPQNDSLPEYRDYLEWLAKGNTPADSQMPDLQYSRANSMVGTIMTLDATPATLFTGPLQQGAGYVADYTVVAIQRNSPYNMLYGRWMQAAKRVSTAAALVGTQVPVIPPTGDAAATGLVVSTAVSGTDFLIRVTGLAGVQIRWILKGEFFRVAPSGFVIEGLG